MTKKAGRKKLQKHGYDVYHQINGEYTAEKGYLKYTAKTISGLLKKIF
jgi:hypothetical protein